MSGAAPGTSGGRGKARSRRALAIIPGQVSRRQAVVRRVPSHDRRGRPASASRRAGGPPSPRRSS